MLFERGDCATLRAWGTILAFESQPSRGLISMNQLNFEGRLAAAPEMSNHGGTKVTRIRVIHNEPTGTDQETGEFVAVDDLGANMISHISHEGDTCLLPLVSSDNELRVESGYHVAGKVKIEFYPPYL